MNNILQEALMPELISEPGIRALIHATMPDDPLIVFAVVAGCDIDIQIFV